MLGSQGLGLGSVGTAAQVGGGAGVIPYLAQVYAAGAGDPKTKDLMAMASGTTARFQANTDANPLPLVGIYETAASKPLATSGYPAIGQSLATDLSLLVGGRLFNWFEMFDPNWTGAFSQLAGYSWHVDTVSFQQAASTAWLRNHNTFADRSYTASKNWQPQSTPPGPIGSGPGTMLHQISLYNTQDDALQIVDQLDAFGQTLRLISPIRNGVIYETALHYSNRVTLPAADDGVGVAVFDGNLNHGGDVPQAAFDFRTVGATTAGDWYAAIALRDTAGDGLLHDIATFSRTGITFNAPISQSVPAAGVPVVIAAPINWMIVGFYNFAMPLVAGKKFVVTGARSTFETRDAALTTGPTLFVAQNGVDITTTPIGLTPATVDAVPAPVSINSTFTNLVMADTTTNVLQAHVSIAAAGAGLTTCTGHLYLQGVYV